MAALGTARGCCNGRVTAILLGHQLLTRGGTKLLVAQHTESSRATAPWVAVRSSVSPVQVCLHPWRAAQVSALYPWRVLEALSLAHTPFFKDHPVEILASKTLGLCAKTTRAPLSCSRHPGFSLSQPGPRRQAGIRNAPCSKRHRLVPLHPHRAGAQGSRVARCVQASPLGSPPSPTKQEPRAEGFSF